MCVPTYQQGPGHAAVCGGVHGDWEKLGGACGRWRGRRRRRGGRKREFGGRRRGRRSGLGTGGEGDGWEEGAGGFAADGCGDGAEAEAG